jgi:hypothetical protein
MPISKTGMCSMKERAIDNTNQNGHIFGNKNKKQLRAETFT